MNTFQKLSRTLAIISFVSAASLANAQDTDSTTARVADTANVQVTHSPSTADSTTATEAEDPRWGSPRVDRTARPSDPIAKATTTAERAKRFADEEREWQRLSTP